MRLSGFAVLDEWWLGASTAAGCNSLGGVGRQASQGPGSSSAQQPAAGEAKWIRPPLALALMLGIGLVLDAVLRVVWQGRREIESCSACFVLLLFGEHCGLRFGGLASRAFCLRLRLPLAGMDDVGGCVSDKGRSEDKRLWALGSCSGSRGEGASGASLSTPRASLGPFRGPDSAKKTWLKTHSAVARGLAEGGFGFC